MRCPFFDTSALVKRYHEEAGGDAVDAPFERDTTVVLTSITAVEMVSAFRRNYNRGKLSATETGRLVSRSTPFSTPPPVEGVTILSADEELVSAVKARGVDVIRPDADGSRRGGPAV